MTSKVLVALAIAAASPSYLLPITRVSAEAITSAGLPADAKGVVVADGAAIIDQVAELLTLHRVWDRYPTVSK